jgi:hypothetical protein
LRGLWVPAIWNWLLMEIIALSRSRIDYPSGGGT